MADTVTGQICWYEVPATDIARASSFYKSVLGWDTDGTATNGAPSPLDGVKTVHMFSKGLLHGAFLHVSEPSSSDKVGPVATFMVDSIEDTLAKVESAGGKTKVSKTAIGEDRGYLARFIDSEGNLQGLWAAK